MLCIRKGQYVLVCDGPTCPERIELANTRASGWMLTTPLGPHWCPADVSYRFAQLMNRTFSDPFAA